MKFLLRVLLKALLLFALANLLCGTGNMAPLGRISAYNGLFPGRPRFPFGEAPREAYSFSLFNVDAMFAAHEITARESGSGDFRVVLLGDSSVWGTLLRPEETLAGQLNALGLSAPDGRRMRFYNLGYPTLSLTKDLLLLERARQSAPDLVVWLVTLEAFPRGQQLSVPLLENNPELAAQLLERYQLDLPAETLRPPGFFERTLIGQRKNLADLLRLQLYGVLWSATGIDQAYPADSPRAQLDLEADPTFHGAQDLRRADLAFEVLFAGQAGLGKTPLLVVNEPILISRGANSDLRYNFYYPRRAYDQYRVLLSDIAGQRGLNYLDAWDIVPPEEFTNSAIHLDRRGTARLAQQVQAAVLQAVR